MTSIYESCRSELQKIAVEKPSWFSTHLPAVTAMAGGLMGAAAIGAGLLAKSPAARAHLLADFSALGKGGGHAVDRAKSLPAAVMTHANAVASYLHTQGIDPKKARIAVVGTGGTGKSSLAKGLGKAFGMDVLHLDDAGRSIHGRDLAKYVRKNAIPAGVIAEQAHLLNQVDPAKFDAIIHIQKPMSDVKSQILKRGRGAMQLEVYDYDKLHRNITRAFDATAGAAQHVVKPSASSVTSIRVKIQPGSGFVADQKLNQQLRQLGVNASELTREQKIMSIDAGKRVTSRGVLPYLRAGRIAGAAGLVGAGTTAGTVGGYYAGKQYSER